MVRNAVGGTKGGNMYRSDRPFWSTWRRRSALPCLAALVVGGLSTVVAPGIASAASSSSSGPIVVGGIDAGFNYPGTEIGFQARIARFNKAGGLGGRKIKFLGVSDDQDGPSAALADIQQLTESDHVFAIAPYADDVFSDTDLNVLSQTGTPVIGYGVTQTWCNSKWTISIIGCQQSTVGWEGTSSVQQIINASKMPASKLRVAMDGYNVNAAVQVTKTLGEVWTKLGAKVVLAANDLPLAGTSNYAPYVQKVLASNPNIVFTVTGGAVAVAYAAALKQAGYTGIVYNGSSYEPSALKTQPSVAAALKGVYVTNLMPTQYDGTPAVKQELRDQAAIGAPADIEIGTAVGYWSADLFIQLLQATKNRGVPVTPANFVATVAKGVTITPQLAGGNGPLSWPLLLNKPHPCTATVQGAGTTYRLFQKYTCYKVIKVAPPTT
jgi:ABC-type branched-subunit amino acid transport system substrate-binding protein